MEAEVAIERAEPEIMVNYSLNWVEDKILSEMDGWYGGRARGRKCRIFPNEEKLVGYLPLANFLWWLEALDCVEFYAWKQISKSQRYFCVRANLSHFYGDRHIPSERQNHPTPTVCCKTETWGSTPRPTPALARLEDFFSNASISQYRNLCPQLVSCLSKLESTDSAVLVGESFRIRVWCE